MFLSSVRFQLTVWNVLVLMVILFGCGLALLFQMQASLLQNIDRELADHVRPALSAPFGPRPPQPGFQQSGQSPAGFMNDQPFPMPPGPPPDSGQGPPGPRHPNDMRVLNPRGVDMGAGGLKAFDEDSFLRSLGGETVSSTVEQNHQLWRVYSTPRRRPDGQIGAVVQAEQSLAPMEQEKADLVRTLLTLIPLGLIAAGVGGAFLTGRSLRPVQRIATEVDRIQAEDLGRRLPEAGNDEFSRLTKTLNAMLGRLKAAFEEQRRFTMDASHELKTPLTVIKAKTSIALTKPRQQDVYRAVIETVDHAADQMAQIVQDLLLLAQADSGHLGRDRQMVLIQDMIHSALAGVWAEGGPPVAVELGDPPPTVPCNPGQLTRVVRNLVENAVRHTPKSGSVTVGAVCLPDGVQITVADDGEGIAPEHLPHLTERFYRVDTARSRETGGSGLGLAICKSIVEAHKGRLEIESAVGAGTTVRIWLPDNHHPESFPQ
ncbi:MAG TPA: ATP-binding protein [Capsulimonadaceae bacterium]|nr:ATP-binding protein [Capsulimonadaceae bacterium]